MIHLLNSEGIILLYRVIESVCSMVHLLNSEAKHNFTEYYYEGF